MSSKKSNQGSFMFLSFLLALMFLVAVITTSSVVKELNGRYGIPKAPAETGYNLLLAIIYAAIARYTLFD